MNMKGSEKKIQGNCWQFWLEYVFIVSYQRTSWLKIGFALRAGASHQHALGIPPLYCKSCFNNFVNFWSILPAGWASECLQSQHLEKRGRRMATNWRPDSATWKSPEPLRLLSKTLSPHFPSTRQNQVFRNLLPIFPLCSSIKCLKQFSQLQGSWFAVICNRGWDFFLPVSPCCCMFYFTADFFLRVKDSDKSCVYHNRHSPFSLFPCMTLSRTIIGSNLCLWKLSTHESCVWVGSKVMWCQNWR